MNPASLPIAAVVASVITTVWHNQAHRHREIRHHREMCNHVWGEPSEVGAGSPMFGEFFVRWCQACGEQMHCNPDGTKYIPLSERPRGE